MKYEPIHSLLDQLVFLVLLLTSKGREEPVRELE
jgi:hypothetical protein